MRDEIDRIAEVVRDHVDRQKEAFLKEHARGPEFDAFVQYPARLTHSEHGVTSEQLVALVPHAYLEAHDGVVSPEVAESSFPHATLRWAIHAAATCPC